MNSKTKILRPVIIVWISSIIIFSLVLWFGEWMNTKEVPKLMIGMIRGLLLSVGFGILCLMASSKSGNWKELLGLDHLHNNIKHFIIGSLLLVGPILITLFISDYAGWASFNINPNVAIFKHLLISILIVFLFEAFPEEFMFRGYILGQLRNGFGKWAGGIITVLLFIMFPLIAVPIQKHIINMPISVGGNATITSSYLIYMTFFGSITVCLRYLTRNIWTTIGFHLVFVSMNYLIGIQNSSLIIISNQTSELPVQITLLSNILLVLTTLVLLTRKKKRKNEYLPSIPETKPS